MFTLGDNVYGDGSAQQYNDFYDPTWGRHKARTMPVPGNHDYDTPNATGYFDYFGAAAGDPDKGYYSYDLGDWHIITLNTECSEIGGCAPTSPQGLWLQTDLAASPGDCTLALMHKPRFSSGPHGNSSSTDDLWQILYDAGADVVLSGHDHHYERFAPQDGAGVLDPLNGIRQFVVGTGGTNLRPLETIQANSEISNSVTHGVLKLTLNATSYDWEFVPIAGQTFTDSGSAACNLRSGNQAPATSGGAADALQLTQRETPRHDVSGDGQVTALDALQVINALSVLHAGSLDEDQIGEMDVNEDGTLSALDALVVVNYLSRAFAPQGESIVPAAPFIDKPIQWKPDAVQDPQRTSLQSIDRQAFQQPIRQSDAYALRSFAIQELMNETQIDVDIDDMLAVDIMTNIVESSGFF